MKLSIITPIYNRAYIFERTIKSVASQLTSEVEYIVVSDGSEDISELQRIVQRYQNYQIRFFHYPVNAGIGSAINLGISKSDGEWITFIGSDDEFLPGAIDKLVANLIPKNAENDFFYFRLQYDNGLICPTFKPQEYKLDLVRYLKFIQSNINKNMDVGTCIRKSVIEKVKYPEDWAYENYYHLRVNRDYKGVFETDILKLIHFDATERGSIPNLHITNAQQFRRIQGQRSGFINVLNDFGSTLYEYSNSYYDDVLKKIVTRSFRLLFHPRFYFQTGEVSAYLSLIRSTLSYTKLYLLLRARIMLKK